MTGDWVYATLKRVSMSLFMIIASLRFVYLETNFMFSIALWYVRDCFAMNVAKHNKNHSSQFLIIVSHKHVFVLNSRRIIFSRIQYPTWSGYLLSNFINLFCISNNLT